MSGVPDRHCSGGPHSGRWCGARATVVCTAADGLQWYACDELAHQERAKTLPIAEWFATLFPPVAPAEPETWK